MGVDKALVPLDGRPMVEHVRAALEEVTAECWLSVRHGQQPPLDGLPVVRDDGRGPLGGIASGLARLGDGRAALLAVACDMPRVSPPMLRALIDALEDSDAAVAVVDGIPQVACAVWSSRRAGIAAELVASGAAAPRALLDRARVTVVPGERWREELRSFDRPEDIGGHVA